MSSTLIVSTLISSILVCSIAPASIPAPKLLATFSDNWMERHAPVIGNTPLNKLFIPGSHNSGSYELINPSNLPPNDPFPSQTTTTRVDQSTWAKIGYDWSTAVQLDLSHQLSDGIRFLDLQICADKLGNFRFCNNYYGGKVSEGLSQISQFAKTNQKEIILVSFRGFYGWAENNTFTNDQHAELRSLIELNLVNLTVDHTAVKPDSSLNTIWQQNVNRPVIVLYDNVDSGSFWSSADYMINSYVDTWQVDEKKLSLINGIAARTDAKLFKLDGYVNPSFNAFILSTDPTGDGKKYPKNLKEMADQTNPVLFDWITNEWVPLSSIGMFNPLNIVVNDFYHNTCLFQLTQNLNKIPNATLEGCQIQQTTKWQLWKASQTCPDNYPDSVTKCTKPSSYGRGVGYAWQFGDPLNTSKQMQRCEVDQGKGNCEVWGAVVYPKCKELFDSYGCCMCTAECPGFLISVSPTSCLKV